MLRWYSALLQTQCLEGLRDISSYLQYDGLKDHVLLALGIKDSFKGTVALASITPLLTEAFHRRWLLAQDHQRALVAAVDLRDTGQLDWELFSRAAALIAHTLTPGKAAMSVEQSHVFEAFQSAARLSGQPDTCTLEHARMKLAARFWRLWSLEKLLPAQDVSLTDKETRRLPFGFESVLREKAQSLQPSIAAAVQVSGAAHFVVSVPERIGTLSACVNFTAGSRGSPTCACSNMCRCAADEEGGTQVHSALPEKAESLQDPATAAVQVARRTTSSVCLKYCMPVLPNDHQMFFHSSGAIIARLQ